MGSDVVAIENLDAEAERFDRAVSASADVDVFCSGSAFVQSAFLGLQPGRTSRAFRVGDAGYLAFAEREISIGADPRVRRLWEPYEAMWGLACPLVGVSAEPLCAALIAQLEEARIAAGAPLVLVCGLPREGARIRAVVQALSFGHRLQPSNATARCVASLEGGLDGFFARRSPAVRRALRRAQRDAEHAGLRVEHHRPSADEVATLYARAVALDDVSWKGRAEVGLRGSGLHAFYAEMLPRLARERALRMLFVVDGDTDVAYLFGGVLGASFRGLQFAFRAGREAQSLGNVAQLAAITALCDEGMTRYDLGVAADYKHKWAESLVETTSLFAIPGRS